MTFEKAKEGMVDYLKDKLRKNQRNTIGGEVGVRRTEEINKYLTGIIQSVENGQLSPARDYFDGLRVGKEHDAEVAATALRETMNPSEEQKKKIDDLKKKAEEYKQKADAAQKSGDFQAMNAYLKEAGNLEDNIGGAELRKTRARQDLARAQNDPDLEKFTQFVRAIDGEMERKVRQVA